MTIKSFAASVAGVAVALATGLAASSFAVAQQPPAPAPAETLAPGALFDKIMSTMQCKEGQVCQTQTRSTKRGIRVPGDQPEPFDLKTEGGRRSLEVAAKRGTTPSLDVEIYFAYNSAQLTEESRKKLNEVGAAFRERGLAGSTFAIVGHTDAAGSEGFNLSLSERRAAAVREYLVKSASVENNRLNAWGRGKTEPKVPDDPMAAANRRVQLINSGNAVSASAVPATSTTSPAAVTSGQSTPAPSTECRRYSPTANKVIACSE